MVRGLEVKNNGNGVNFSRAALFESTAYPANTPVGKQGRPNRHVEFVGGVTDDNAVPWCVKRSGDTDAAKKDLATFLANNMVNGQPLPVCPEALLNAVATDERLTEFAARGALNAGFAIFYYLDQVSKGLASTARFDECTLVPPSK